MSKGRWETGTVRLASNVALVVDEGSGLHFPEDPELAKSPELVTAIGCTNVAVLGKGTLSAAVDYWHQVVYKKKIGGGKRPKFFHFRDSAQVRFEGFRVRGSPSWTMHFLMCDDIVVRGVDVKCDGPNTDGLDLESCSRALVENCRLDQGDDTYTIKSGMNAAGRKRARPCQDIVIRNCVSVRKQLLGVGSEVSGGVRNVFMTDCEVAGEVLRFLHLKTNSHRGGYVENVTLQNIHGGAVKGAMVHVNMFYDGNPIKELPNTGTLYPTRIKGIHLKNVSCTEADRTVRVDGDEHLEPEDIRLENVKVDHPRKGMLSANHVKGLVVR